MYNACYFRCRMTPAGCLRSRGWPNWALDKNRYGHLYMNTYIWCIWPKKQTRPWMSSPVLTDSLAGMQRIRNPGKDTMDCRMIQRICLAFCRYILRHQPQTQSYRKITEWFKSLFCKQFSKGLSLNRFWGLTGVHGKMSNMVMWRWLLRFPAVFF